MAITAVLLSLLEKKSSEFLEILGYKLAPDAFNRLEIGLNAGTHAAARRT